MIYFNIVVIETDRFKAKIPFENRLIICDTLYDLQMRMYDHLDNCSDIKDYRLLFLTKPTKYEQLPIGSENISDSSS